MEEIIERKKISFEDFHRFHIETKNYSKQFNGIYKARLNTLKSKALKQASAKWNKAKVLNIVDLTNDEDYKDLECILIGTIYKHQELKPSILKEIADELQAIPQPSRSNFCSPKDSLFLEDNVSRVKLVGNISADALVTGLVSAVFGKGLENGTFWVYDHCFPGDEFQSSCLTTSSSSNDEEKYILLLSGLDLANTAHNIALELLKDWITGMIGDISIQQKVSKIVKVIIAGNSIRGSLQTFNRKGYFQNKFKNSISANEIQSAVHRLDEFINYIGRSCEVILMPGEHDPSCHAIPQQPFHKSIFPISAECGNLYGTTNPWIGKIGSRTIIGSSGQSITDIIKVSNLKASPLEWMEKTLSWLHYAPTAPDTLAEYPYDEVDPFVINEYPDIYFTGNMDKYETKVVEKISKNDESNSHLIRLICIPKFSSSHMAVLVNLESLDTSSVSFAS